MSLPCEKCFGPVKDSFIKGLVPSTASKHLLVQWRATIDQMERTSQTSKAKNKINRILPKLKNQYSNDQLVADYSILFNFLKPVVQTSCEKCIRIEDIITDQDSPKKDISSCCCETENNDNETKNALVCASEASESDLVLCDADTENILSPDEQIKADDLTDDTDSINISSSLTLNTENDQDWKAVKHNVFDSVHHSVDKEAESSDATKIDFNNLTTFDDQWELWEPPINVIPLSPQSVMKELGIEDCAVPPELPVENEKEEEDKIIVNEDNFVRILSELVSFMASDEMLHRQEEKPPMHFE